MELKNGDEGPCQLLFVNRRNLARVVQTVAPEMILIPRERFERIATAMLEVVETVAGEK